MMFGYNSFFLPLIAKYKFKFYLLNDTLQLMILRNKG